MPKTSSVHWERRMRSVTWGRMSCWTCASVRQASDGRVILLRRSDISLVTGDAVMSKTMRLG